MTAKIALEEHFAIPDYNRHRPPFLGDELWRQVQRRIVDFTEIRLPEMDRHGIDYAVISLTSPGVQSETDPAVAAERARRANDVLADAVQAHPQRFGGFAAVPLQDVDAAVVEMTRSVTELGFHGVLVNSWTAEPGAASGISTSRGSTRSGRGWRSWGSPSTCTHASSRRTSARWSRGSRRWPGRCGSSRPTARPAPCG